MYRSAYSLEGYSIGCIDGECGKVTDFLFDDRQHNVRYIAAETGNWLLGREVLISPVAIEQADYDSQSLMTALSQNSVKQSPGIETDQPVSRQKEIEVVEYYNWPMYWSQPGMGVPVIAPRSDIGSSTQVDTTLRSFNEVRGYTIQCVDGELGHIEDLIIDTDDWTLRYLAINSGNWLPGKKFVVAFDWLMNIDWAKRDAYIDLTKEQVESAPEYDPRVPVNAEQETVLYDFYGRKKIW